jgi:hypothetical protein
MKQETENKYSHFLNNGQRAETSRREKKANVSKAVYN